MLNTIQTLVNSLANKAKAEIALFAVNSDSGNSYSLLSTTADFPLNDVDGLTYRLKTIAFEPYQPVYIDAQLNFSALFRSAIALPLYALDQQLGALIFASSDDALNETILNDDLSLELNMLSLALENRFLREVTAFHSTIGQAILDTAEKVAEFPSPQELVETLHDHLFPPEISGCAILLYGPLDETEPDAPFEFMEISGVWTRKRGAGGGLGVRLSVEDYRKRLALLEQTKFHVFHQVSRVLNFFDPLVRGLLRAADMQSLAVFNLHAGGRSRGILLLTSDEHRHFTPYKVYIYRTIAKYMALSIFGYITIQQRNRVHEMRRAMLDAVSNGILLVHPGSNGGHVISSNANFEQFFDLYEASLSGKTLASVLAEMTLPEDVRQSLTQQWINRPVRSNDTRQGEFRIVHSSGQPLEILWKSTPVYQEGHVRGRVYAFHDATADRAAARMRAEFLSRISHELRTPLTSIQGFAEFILEVGGDDLPAAVHEYTQIILSSAKHLKAIISNIIDITRLDAGQIQLVREFRNLPEILKETAASMEPHYRKRGQKISLKMDDWLPPVNIDLTRIRQVLINLTSNAIKYAPENSEIQIHAKYVVHMSDLPESSPSNIVLPALLISIYDEGQGVSIEDAERIFMPFFRTEQARRDRIEGVGLGLTIVQSLVEVHQGKVWVTPTPLSSGGCFMFTLPVARKPEIS